MSWRFGVLAALLFISLASFAEEASVTSSTTTTTESKGDPFFGKTAGNVAITSDYMDRGVSQTDHGPAVQAGLDWSHPTGLAAGIWGSNVYFPLDDGTDNLLVDLSFGYRRQITDDLTLGLMAVHSAYFPKHSVDMWEFPLTANYKTFTAGIAYAPRYNGVEGTGWYLIGEWSDALLYEIRANLHVGYNLFSPEVGMKDYADFRIGLSREILGINVDVSGTFVSLRQANGLDDPRVVLTLSKSF